MKYMTCPECGKRLFKTTVSTIDTRVEMNCPKCGKPLILCFNNKEVRISDDEPKKNTDDWIQINDKRIKESIDTFINYSERLNLALYH